jgi:hypothetical protein
MAKQTVISTARGDLFLKRHNHQLSCCEYILLLFSNKLVYSGSSKSFDFTMPSTSLPENEVAELKEHFEWFDLNAEGALLSCIERVRIERPG